MSTLWLQTRLAIAIAAMFALIYGFITLIAYLLGFAYPLPLAIIALLIVLVQYLTGPKMVEISMRVRYIKREDNPKLYGMVEHLASEAKLPMPKVGISQIKVPNAFAFGRSRKDGRVCVTAGLLERLNEEEMEAVLGHEMSHLRHRDMVVITTLSVVPLICYIAFWSFLWGRGRRNEGVIIAIIAFFLYLLTNLIVLYVSRIREYYADYGSVELTGKPYALASALYRITLDTTRVDAKELKKVEGSKAFLATDPSTARRDIMDLREADLNLDGHLDMYEVEKFARSAKVKTTDKILEIVSSHPNVVGRIKKLVSIK
ncbi:MAG: zinc metalloprotease HtpX [Candidatus Thermoplasmatota archaeon]|nr:zinc metalloprotease HtpX [Candidatus Thermoplasmatota archaeon]